MKILLIGYGAMNQRVARLAEEKGHEIVGVIENTPKATTPYQQYQHIADVKDADVAIDFSNPNLLFPLLDEAFHLPLVVATTGEKEKLLNKLDELSKNMPVFFSANMSYGVHALTKILAAAVPLLDDFDIELTEAHHNKKVDAPSGTLEKLYDVIVSLKENVTPVYDRHELNENASHKILVFILFVEVRLSVNMKFYLPALMKRFKSRIVHNQKIFLRMVQYKQQNA